jgi:putative phage-type endonuclease
MMMAYEVIGHWPAGDPRWHTARSRGIGASEIAAVLGESPFQSALELWSVKTGAIPQRDLSGVEAVEWGHRLEPVIIDAYRDRTGRTARADGRTLRSLEHQWALCTLDGWTAGDSGDEHPLEIKAVGLARSEEWEEGPPEHYRLQLQHQMLVTGARVATIAALIGGQRLVWCDVERDETTIRKIAHQGERFWRLVESRTPPEVDGSESSRRALAALYPTDDGETIVLDGGAIDAFDELEEIARLEKELEGRKRLAENTVKAALGNATRGVLMNGAEFTWKTQSMPERVLAASSYRVLRRKAPKKERKVA